MSDLISRQDALDAVNDCGICIQKILDIPSVEPERKTKVETVEKPNVFKCSECGQYFHSTAWGSPVEYCSRCGAKLDWSGMSNLIDRQKAINVFEILADKMTDEGKTVMAQAVAVLKDLPSAEPERKKGKWEVQPSTGEDRPFIWWKCSECGHVIFSETERDRKEFHAFCGRCGADMRGEHGKA